MTKYLRNNTKFYISKSIKDLMDSTIDYKFHNLDPEYFYYFIIRLINLLNKFNEGKETQIYLYNHVERNYYGRHTEKIGGITKRPYIFDTVKKVLLDNNIIYQTGYSQSLHLSRRYSLSNLILSKLNNSDITSIELTKKKLIKNKNVKPMDYISKMQYELLSSKRFHINEVQSVDYINNNNKLNNQQKIFNKINVYNINSKQIFVSKGTKNNRIISSFTNLKSGIRQYCYIDGEQLESIDLQSSQITLFVHYLLNKYPDNKDLKYFYKIVTEKDIYTYVLDKCNVLNLNNYKIWNSIF